MSHSRPPDIHIDDIEKPALTTAQQAAIAHMESNPIPLSIDAVLGAAMKATGLTNFGADDFRERLALQMACVAEDTQLNALGRAGIFADWVRYASNRLLFENLRRQNPDIQDAVIERPIIVAGLPRSGTTHLLNLMAADPRLRSVPYWESREPIPPPGETPTWDVHDPRYQRCEKQWQRQDAMLPHLRAMHEMSPDHVHEELELENLDFSSYNLEWLAHVPRWRDAYLAHDQRPHYAYMKDVLRALQWLRGGERWVLKCPQHMEQLPVLRDTFPDATIVITHRDPVEVISSIVTMLAYGQRIKCHTIDTRALAHYWIDRIERLLRACVRDRDALPAAQVMDLPFAEFMADDLAAVRRIYALAGLPVTTQSEQALRHYLDTHPRGKYGRVVYHLERDFHVSIDELHERFAFYYARYDVKGK